MIDSNITNTTIIAACAIPVTIGQWPGLACFRFSDMITVLAADDLTTQSTGSQVLVTQEAGSTYTQGDSG